MNDFDAIDALLNVKDKQTGQFPWETALGHDHSAAEDAVRAIYEALKLAPPRIAWASSPASMWRAVQILKGYAHKHAFVDSMLPPDYRDVQGAPRIESEAQRSVLLAILDTDVMTSTGAALKGMITPRWGRYDGDAPHSRVIVDINQLIASQEEGGIRRQALATKGFASRQARFHENIVCPALYPESPAGLTRHCFSLLPYARVCWLCMPPEYVRTDAEGHLHAIGEPAARWSDGFELWRNREEELRLEAERRRPILTADGARRLTAATGVDYKAGDVVPEMTDEEEATDATE